MDSASRQGSFKHYIILLLLQASDGSSAVLAAVCAEE
jgi:hypothetical protein